MGDHARPNKKGRRGLAGGSRLHEAAEAAARVGGALLRARGIDPTAVAQASDGDVGEPPLAALDEARRRLREAEEGHARALARAAQRWEKERAALEMQMTGLVQEIGAAKHIVERVGELEGEVERLRAEVASHEETARLADAECGRLRALLAASADEQPREGTTPGGTRAARAAVAGGARGTA
ncbi:MAG: hypothetical protein ACKO2K_22430 [Alphaproteobacteria bacterium]